MARKWADRLLAQTANKLLELNAERKRIVAGLQHSDEAKQAIGDIVGRASRAVGVVRGVGNNIGGVVDTAKFLQDHLGRVPTLAEVQQFIALEVAGVKKVASAVSHPKATAQAVNRRVEGYNAALNPSATPMAATLPDEISRRAAIGRNQGEAIYQLGVAGSAALATKGAFMRDPVMKSTTVDDYLAEGRTMAEAERLVAPYDGAGHHSPGLQWTEGLPESVRNSRFFVYKPKVPVGEFHTRHYMIDPSFHGTKLPGGGSWSGKRLGLQKYGLLDRLAYGMPGASKVAHILSGIGGAQSVYEDATGTEFDDPAQIR
jgi:hypothetical protein